MRDYDPKGTDDRHGSRVSATALSRGLLQKLLSLRSDAKKPRQTCEAGTQDLWLKQNPEKISKMFLHS